MKTKMRKESLDAYDDVLRDVAPKEKIVLKAIKKIQPCSDQEIADELLWPINRVTGRRNDLVNKKELVEHDSKAIRNGRHVNLWRLSEHAEEMLS